MSGKKTHGRNTSAWQRARAEVLARSTHCWLCGRPLYPHLSGRHRWGSTVDHVTELEDGAALLDPANLRAAHNTCNASKAGRRQGQRKRERAAPALDPRSWMPHVNPSRKW